jgi:hypothetical protein
VRLIPSIERTPVTLGDIFNYCVYPLVVRGLAATVFGMALPMSYEPDPDPVPPPAEPGPIRVCLTGQMLAEFDREWDFVLEEAKRIHSLAGVQDLLAKWRLMAYTELKQPGSYARMMSTIERTLATGKAPAGSISGEEMMARIQARLAS